MANNAGPLQAGYGNGGIEPMDQFEKLSDKIGNSLKNLEFTRDMIRQLAENEKKSAKSIATILNQKNKSLRFSVVDQAIQNYWKKQESNRRHFAAALQTKIIQGLDSYINSARDRKKKLTKENSKIQRNFIESKKETTKQKQIGLKEWQKLEEQIQKNDQHKKTNKLSKIKDLKPLQDKCSKAFAKYESYVAKLNELEQSNHQQSCKIGELLHESQKYAADRLSMHYNMAVSSKKYFDEFIASNKSIVQSKAPPLNDILWRWLTFPKNHQTHTLPCTSKEVFSKKSIGQGFKRRVEPDYQQSQFLKPPKQSKSKSKSKPKQQQQQQQETTKRIRDKKINKKKNVKKPKKQQPQQQPTDDNWDVDFGEDNNNNNNDVFKSTNNGMSDEEFFGNDNNDNVPETKQDNNDNDNFNDNFGGFDDGNADIFGTVQDVKQAPVEKKQEPKQKDLVQQHKEDTEINGFDAGFDDNFGNFGDNKDLAIADDNDGGGGGFGGDWNTNFDEDAFDTNTDNNNIPQQNEDVDALFAASEANDIFGTNTNTNNGTSDNNNNNNNNNNNDDLFGDDLFGNNNNNDNDVDVVDDGGGGGLFDDEFDDDQAIEFPEFDINGTEPTKKRKSKLKKKKKQQLETVEIVETVQPSPPQPSPQPNSNEITTIPEAVVSFDAPQPINDINNIDDTDNPFGADPFNADNDDDNDNNIDIDDTDNPFAMFEEPDNNNNNNNNDNDEFDPFG